MLIYTHVVRLIISVHANSWLNWIAVYIVGLINSLQPWPTKHHNTIGTIVVRVLYSSTLPFLYFPNQLAFILSTDVYVCNVSLRVLTVVLWDILELYSVKSLVTRISVAVSKNYMRSHAILLYCKSITLIPWSKHEVLEVPSAFRPAVKSEAIGAHCRYSMKFVLSYF